MANDERTLEAYFAGIMEEGSDDDEEYFPNEDWKQVHWRLRGCSSVGEATLMVTFRPPGSFFFLPSGKAEGYGKEATFQPSPQSLLCRFCIASFPVSTANFFFCMLKKKTCKKKRKKVGSGDCERG